MAKVMKIIFYVLSGYKFLLLIRSCTVVGSCLCVKFSNYGYNMQLGVAVSEMFIIYERSSEDMSFSKVASPLGVEYMYLIKLFES